LNRQLRDALSDEHMARERIEALLREASEMGIPLDTATLEFVVRRQAEIRARDFWKNPRDVRALEALDTSVRIARSLPFKVNLWQVQNLFAQRLDGTFDAIRAEANKGDEASRQWITSMTDLAKSLDLRVGA
jgi:hypothetical protein